MSRQLDGLRDGSEGLRDYSHSDSLSYSILTCTHPHRKCSCDNTTFDGRDGFIEVWADSCRGGVLLPKFPVLFPRGVCLSSNAIGSSLPRRQAITEEMWALGTRHFVHDYCCVRGKLELKYGTRPRSETSKYWTNLNAREIISAMMLLTPEI